MSAKQVCLVSMLILIILQANANTNFKPEVKGEGGPGSSIEREHDPEYDEIISSARPSKSARRTEEIEVVDLSED